MCNPFYSLPSETHTQEEKNTNETEIDLIWFSDSSHSQCGTGCHRQFIQQVQLQGFKNSAGEKHAEGFRAKKKSFAPIRLLTDHTVSGRSGLEHDVKHRNPSPPGQKREAGVVKRTPVALSQDCISEITHRVTAGFGAELTQPRLKQVSCGLILGGLAGRRFLNKTTEVEHNYRVTTCLQPAGQADLFERNKDCVFILFRRSETLNR